MPVEQPSNGKEITPQQAEVMRISDSLYEGLQLPDNLEKQEWSQQLTSAFSPVAKPDAANVKNPSNVRMKYLQEEHAKIAKQEEFALALFRDLAEEYRKQKAQGEALEHIYTPIALEKIAALIEMKHVYEAMLKEEKPSELKLPFYLAIYASVLAQSKVAGAMPLAESGKWSWKLMRAMDIQTQRSLLDAQRRVIARLEQAGVKNLPNFAELMLKAPGESAKVFGKILEKATPSSYYDIILLAYVINTTDDKLGATLHFGMFLAANGLAEVAIEAAASRLAALRFLPKHPAIQAAAALAIVIGLDTLIGFENVIKYFESRTNPALWDMGGNVADMMAGSALYGQGKALVHEGAYWMGVPSVDPEFDQKSFLSQQVMMANYEKGEPLGRNFVHTIQDWDDFVEVAVQDAERHGNPVRARLFRLEQVNRGPGGVQEWKKRQSVEVFRMAEMLRGMEQELNEQLAKEGIISSATGFGSMDLCNLALQEQEEGDVGIRGILQNDQYVKIQEKITALPDKEKRESMQHLFDQCVSWAKRIAKTVSMYTHNKCYQRSWTTPRREQGVNLIPSDVEDGLVATMVFSSRRREALDPASYPQVSRPQFGTNVSECFRYNNDPDPWPSVIEHPIEWFYRFRKFNADTNDRMISDAEQYSLLPVFLRDVGRISGSNEHFRQALEPILTHIQQKKDDLRPREAMRAVLGAFAEAVPDDLLRREHNDTALAGLTTAFTKENESPTVSAGVMEGKVNTFCTEGPRFTYYKKHTLAFGADHQLEYDRKQQRWMVRIKSSMTNPDSIGFAYMGVAVTPHSKRASDRVIPFETWARSHPQSALSVSKDLVWHQKWIDYMEKVLPEARARQHANEEKRERERAEKDMSLQERAREAAKKNPEVWQPYAGVYEGRKFDYVAYHPGTKAYVFVEIPNFRRQSYVSRPGAVVPNTSQKVFMRVEAEDGQQFWGSVNGDETKFWEGYKEGKLKRYAHVTTDALAYPVQNTDTVHSYDSDRITLRSIVAAYANVDDPDQWTSAESAVLEDRWYFRNYSSSPRFFNALRQHIHDATRNGDSWNYMTQSDLLTALEETKKDMDEYYKEHGNEKEKQEAATRIEKRRRLNAGKELMTKVDATPEGDHYTKQYGFVANDMLYIKFDSDAGKWQAGYGSLEDLGDPGSFTITDSKINFLGIGSGAEKSNKLLANLVAINEGRDVED